MLNLCICKSSKAVLVSWQRPSRVRACTSAAKGSMASEEEHSDIIQICRRDADLQHVFSKVHERQGRHVGPQVQRPLEAFPPLHAVRRRQRCQRPCPHNGCQRYSCHPQKSLQSVYTSTNAACMHSSCKGWNGRKRGWVCSFCEELVHLCTGAPSSSRSMACVLHLSFCRPAWSCKRRRPAAGS